MKRFNSVIWVSVGIVSLCACSGCQTRGRLVHAPGPSSPHRYILAEEPGYVLEVKRQAGSLVLEYMKGDQVIFATYLDGDWIKTFRYLHTEKPARRSQLTIVGTTRKLEAVREDTEGDETVYLLDFDGDGLMDKKAFLNTETRQTRVVDLKWEETESDEKEETKDTRRK